MVRNAFFLNPLQMFDIRNALSIKLNGVTKKSPKSMQAVKCNSYKTKRVTTLNGNGKCIL